MMLKLEKSKLIRYHNGIENFNYDVAIDWAIDLIGQGNETDNVLMLASFSKPADSIEIKPFVSAVLADMGIMEKEGDEAVFELIRHYLSDILNDNAIRYNLDLLYELSLEKDCFDEDKFGLMPFYLLYHGWGELEDIGVNYYFEGADLSNIEEVIKEEAKRWINKYFNEKNEL